jgi:hypothetical protein
MRFIKIVPLAVAVVGACTDQSPTAVGESDLGRTTETPQSSVRQARKLETLDDRLRRLTTSVPGFAGLYYDSTGTLVVRMKGGSRRPGMARTLEAFMTRELKDATQATADVGRMRVVPADYDFAELMDANAEATSLFSDDAVTQMDVDEVRNRVVIGVTDEGKLGRLRSAVARLGKRAPMIEVSVIPPTNVTQSHPTHYFRPVPGGVQITLQIFGSPICTLGWNAYFRDVNGYDGKRYFVTASHCTENLGLVQGDRAGQPSTANIIGHEVADPAFFTNAQDASCPANFICRYSDAALFQYADTAAWNHGRIFVRQQLYWFWYTTYRNILGASDMFRTPSLFIGSPISKMGRTTMVTSGTVANICIASRQFENGVGTNRVMLCQAQGTYASQGGDSGAPVYRVMSTATNSHIQLLLGVHWGTSTIFPDQGPVRATFSEWYLATAELGAAIGSGGWLDPEFGVCPFCGY